MGKIINCMSSIFGLKSIGDDLFSAFISTILALVISWIFYRIGNRNAFKQDILAPITNAINDGLNEERILKIIHESKKLYSYRYGKKKEIAKMIELEKACEEYKENSIEKSFRESILNYFYEVIGEGRFGYSVNEYNFGEQVLCYPDEHQISLEPAFDNEGNYLNNSETKEELISFYNVFIKGNADVERLFNNVDFGTIFNESDEFQKHTNAIKRFRAAKDAIVK